MHESSSVGQRSGFDGEGGHERRSGNGEAVPTSYNIMNTPVMTRVVPFALGLAMLVCAACAQPDGPPAEVAIVERRPGAAPSGASTSAAQPRIVFLGDSLTAGYGLAKEESVPSLIQTRLRCRRVSVRGRERRRVRRHVGRRAQPPGLVARGRREDSGGRARRQRRPARSAGGQHEAQPDRDHHARAGARHQGRAHRHGGAAELRRGLHRRVPRGLSRSREAHRRGVHAVLSRRRGGHSRTEHRRRHSSERRRARIIERHGVA